MEVYILSPTPKLVLTQPPLGTGENIECFIEEQAFSLLYALAPPSFPCQQGFSLSLSSCVSPVKLTVLTSKGGGGEYVKV